MITLGKRRHFSAPQMERRSVTVCIAATCQDTETKDYKVIMCTDWRISGALGSAEIKLKQRVLGRGGWYLLTAGEDGEINAFEKILNAKFNGAIKVGAEIDDTNVPKFVREALSERKRQKIDELIQGQFGLSYDDFLSMGKDKLNPDIFRETLYAIRDIPLDAEFIIAGFSSGYPILVQTESSKLHVREQFAVAGEGGYLAQTVLLNRGQMDVHSVQRTLYCVYEAKRYAEGATSVGSATAMQILSKNGSTEYIMAPGIEMLKKQYEKYGPQSLPAEIEALKPEMFKVYDQ